jgi:hypothetical protein
MKRHRLAGGCGLAVLLFAQCQIHEPTAAAKARSAAAFATVYEVLQHPRCVNCHPAGDAPLVGDLREVHPQGVLRGPIGMGLFALTCPTCHQHQNTAGEHMPPGALRWRLPTRSMPLVFEGLSPAQLAQHLADPRQNGGRQPQELLQHVTADPLVLWGWTPGDGRAPVSVPHAQFVEAFRAWVDGGCQIPN